jgi:hypothetical protein
MELQNIMDDTLCWSMTHPDVRLFHLLLRGDFPSRWLQLLQWPLVSTWCTWPGLGVYGTELLPFMNFLVHSYTCCSDIHSHIKLSSVDEFWWVLPLHNAVLLLCMLQVEPPSLHYYCAVVLHSCIIVPPAGHSLNHEYHCCQLTRQLSCV